MAHLLVIGEPSHVELLRGVNVQLIDVNGRIQQGRGVDALRFGRRAARTIFEAMYYSPSVPRLDRKWRAFATALETGQ